MKQVTGSASYAFMRREKAANDRPCSYVLWALLLSCALLMTFLMTSAQAQDMAGLTLRSSPEGAAVFINGSYLGDTPLLHNAPPGQYQIRLEREGFLSFTTTVDLQAGERLTINSQLQALTPAAPSATPSTAMPGSTQPSMPQAAIPQSAQGSGGFVLRSQVPGARIFVNDRFAGTVPESGELRFVALPVGEYRIIHEGIGLRRTERTINLAAGDMLTVDMRDAAASASSPGMMSQTMQTSSSTQTSSGMMPHSSVTMSAPTHTGNTGSAMLFPATPEASVASGGGIVNQVVERNIRFAGVNARDNQGSVIIDSEPRAAFVHIDGRFLGSTPMNPFPLDAGNYTLRFSKPGYADVQFVIEVRAGETREIRVPLQIR